MLGVLRALRGRRLLAFGVVLLAVLSGVATYAVSGWRYPYNPTPRHSDLASLINLTLVLSLVALVAWRLVRLWGERRSGRAGARLHARLVVMFSAVAVVPAILVAIFAAVTLNLGIEAWFSSRVKTALDGAVDVARHT